MLEYRSGTLLGHVVAAACGSRLDEVVVVLGAAAAEIAARVPFGRARVVVNPNHQLGMGESLRFGLLQLGDGVERAMVILGDQPAVDAGLFDRLLDLQAASGLPSAALRFGDLLHPPVVIERSLWGDLATLEGDVGCRALIRSRPELVAPLPHTGRGDHPIDIDTQDDYERLTTLN